MAQFARLAERCGPQWLDAFGEISTAGEGLKKRLDHRCSPAARRNESAVEEGRLAVTQGLPVRTVYSAACCEQHCVARGGVPLAGRGKTRIDVGLCLGDNAELEA